MRRFTQHAKDLATGCQYESGHLQRQTPHASGKGVRICAVEEKMTIKKRPVRSVPFNPIRLDITPVMSMTTAITAL